MTYDDASYLVQVGGTIFFMLLFAGVATYALWPANKKGFSEAARIPLDDEAGKDGLIPANKGQKP
jgi:cytochrome c oxidase cbb3-type subunit 4